MSEEELQEKIVQTCGVIVFVALLIFFQWVSQ